MELLRWLFSYKGRMGRGAYWGCSVLANLASAPALIVPRVYESSGTPMPLSVLGALFLLWVFMLWPTSAIMVKRGHDRARPAWFSIGLLIAAIATSIAIGLTNGAPVAVLIAVLIFVYQFVDYLCWPASPKAKRYGGSDDYPARAPPLNL